MMIALAVTVIGFGRQFQFASFWGDLGVYTTEAQHLAAGGHVTFDYDTAEMSIPPTNGTRSAPNGMNAALGGSYQFHALPTWPGAMALLGPSFDAAGLLSLLYGLSIGLFYLLAREVFGDGMSTLLATILLAVLPLAWFLSLYATGEMLLLSLTLASAFLFIKTGFHSFILGLGLFAFGIVHISLFVISPLIGMMLFLAGVGGSAALKTSLAKASVVGAVAGGLAVLFALKVSNKYALDIISSVFGTNGYLVWVAAASPLIGTLPFFTGLVAPKLLGNVRKGYEHCLRHAGLIGIVVVAIILCAVALEFYLMGWTSYFVPDVTSPYNSGSARVAYMNRGIMSLAHQSIWSLLGASGLVGLIAFFFLPFVWLLERNVTFSSHLVWLAGAYVVFLYGVMNVDITNNYYASRYLLPVAVPTLLLVGVMWLKRLRSWDVPLVTIVGFVSLFCISALLGQGFFLGDRRFVKELLTHVDVSAGVYVEGSDWLEYMLVPALANTTGGAEMGGSPSVSRNNGVGQLITDSANVIGGRKTCYSYEQRRIPWEITYPLRPEIVEHNVCVVDPSRVGGMNFDGNQWLLGGEMKFIAVGPGIGEPVEVDVESLGWWATKRPFESDLRSITPKLVVCGHEFHVESITAKSIVFAGTMSAAFCHATLSTSTFIPSAIGEGSDTRSLGMDFYALRIHAR